jgi:aspartyl-tRNA synthetase
MHAYRTHNCGALRANDAGQTARLSGWVHRKRDHGGLLFIDLRDHFGLTQCVFPAGSDIFASADAIRAESVITVTGEVVAREGTTVNDKLPTGAIELRVKSLEVQSHAEVLPIQVAGEQEFPEDLRLRYRFLDLRREKQHRNIMLRAGVIASIRRRMIDQGFTEFQTPILTASSPEGARDFLVPRATTPAASTRCRRRRSSSSSWRWWRASTATSRSPPASATKPAAPTAARASSTSSTSR